MNSAALFVSVNGMWVLILPSAACNPCMDCQFQPMIAMSKRPLSSVLHSAQKRCTCRLFVMSVSRSESDLNKKNKKLGV